MEDFKQLLMGPVWDGDLVSKDERDRLKLAGLCDRGLGYNFITMKGIEVAVALGLLHTNRPVAPAMPFPPSSLLKFKPDSLA